MAVRTISGTSDGRADDDEPEAAEAERVDEAPRRGGVRGRGDVEPGDEDDRGGPRGQRPQPGSAVLRAWRLDDDVAVLAALELVELLVDVGAPQVATSYGACGGGVRVGEAHEHGRVPAPGERAGEPCGDLRGAAGIVDAVHQHDALAARGQGAADAPWSAASSITA